MLVLLLLLATASALVTPIFSNITRTVIFQKVSIGVTNTQQELLDIDHLRANSTGLYNTLSLMDLDSRAFNYFIYRYGIDVLSGEKVGGVWFYPNYTSAIISAFPFILGNDDTTTDGTYPFRFMYDSNDKDVEKKLDWVVIGVGWIGRMLASGNFTGTSPNTVYVPGDLISSADYWYLKGSDEANWDKPGNKERITLRSLGTSKVVNNSEGERENYVKVEVEDHAGKIGYGMITTTFTDSSVFSDNGDRVQVTSAMYQWGSVN